VKLYCLRHGEACYAWQDSLSVLTDKGREQVTRLACFLSKSGVKIHSIIHSDKKRAQETASIFAQILKIDNIQESSNLLTPEADPVHLLPLLNSLEEDTLLVGHLPFMPGLINALLDQPSHRPLVEFTPACLVCLERQSNTLWSISFVLPPELL